MNFLNLSDCCNSNLDSVVIIPPAFPKKNAMSRESPYQEKLVLGGSGKAVESPFFLYFSHTPYKQEVKEHLASMVRLFLDRNMPLFGDQHSYALLTGGDVPGAVAEAVEEDEDEIEEAVEFVEEDVLSPAFFAQLTPDRRGVGIDYLTKNFGIELKLGFDREEGASEDTQIPSPWHLDIRDISELKSHVELLKEVTRGKSPVIVSMRGDSSYDICFDALEGKADTILVRCSNPVVELPGVIDAFKDTEAGKRDVKLFVVAPVRNAEDILKIRAMGADAVGFDICHLARMVKDSKGLETFLTELETELNQKLGFYGATDIGSLNVDDLRALNYDTAAVSGIKLIGYDRKLPMWLH